MAIYFFPVHVASIVTKVGTVKYNTYQIFTDINRYS